MNDPKTVTQAFPGFLEAGDLDGKEATLTIAKVRGSKIDDKGLDGKPIDKPIVSFEKAHKEWVLNKTNARTIRSLYGNKFSGWVGRKVTLYPTTCQAFGEKVACIRVRTIDPDTGEAPNLFDA